MPRFIVPVSITMTARDAKLASNTIESSSLHSLEIPGLLCVRVGDAVPEMRGARRCPRTRVSTTQLRRRLVTLLSTAPSEGELSKPQLVALAELLRDAAATLTTFVLHAANAD